MQDRNTGALVAELSNRRIVYAWFPVDKNGTWPYHLQTIGCMYAYFAMARVNGITVTVERSISSTKDVCGYGRVSSGDLTACMRYMRLRQDNVVQDDYTRKSLLNNELVLRLPSLVEMDRLRKLTYAY